MALTEDQKAILRLLAQRGAAGYEDLSALMGISVDEVHNRAEAAAAQLESEGIPAPTVPEPSPGGGEGSGESRSGELSADPSPAPRQKPPEPEEPVPPRPKAELPRGKAKPPLKRELKLLEGRGLWALLAGAAIVVVFLVILLVGGGGGSDSNGSSGAAAAGHDSCKVSQAPKPNGKLLTVLAAAAVKSSQEKEVTRAVLNPTDGSAAKGLAVFGRVKKSLALQVAAEGLAPSGNCGYTIWIAASPTRMLPLASTEVKADGRINAQVEVPVEVLGYLADETFGQIAITRTDESQLKASLAEATKEKKAPAYTGTEVLRGSVRGPIVGAAKRLEAEK